MNQTDYQQFTAALRQNLAANGRVIGLVALGSMAQQDYQPDAWSDHDFFVITQPGAQERMRTALDWLPDAAHIIYHFRETAHGVKVLYASGHLLEFAVFDPSELDNIPVNRYRVLLDTTDELTPLLAQRQAATTHSAARTLANVDQAMGQFLTTLLVGYGRYQRGERLSGHEFIKLYAVINLLKLLTHIVPSVNKSILDNLNPFRRFELAYPQLAAEINAIVQRQTPRAAADLLTLAQRELAPHMDSFPTAAVAVLLGIFEREM